VQKSEGCAPISACQTACEYWIELSFTSSCTWTLY